MDVTILLLCPFLFDVQIVDVTILLLCPLLFDLQTVDVTILLLWPLLFDVQTVVVLYIVCRAQLFSFLFDVEQIMASWRLGYIIDCVYISKAVYRCVHVFQIIR